MPQSLPWPGPAVGPGKCWRVPFTNPHAYISRSPGGPHLHPNPCCAGAGGRKELENHTAPGLAGGRGRPPCPQYCVPGLPRRAWLPTRASSGWDSQGTWWGAPQADTGGGDRPRRDKESGPGSCALPAQKQRLSVQAFPRRTVGSCSQTAPRGESQQRVPSADPTVQGKLRPWRA